MSASASETQKRSKDAVAANRRELFDDAASPVAGNAAAEVTIVQFFDYKCGYCRRVSPTLSTLLEKHKNVRIIYKELPILGADSHMASRAALAAEKQGAYVAFHRELMSLNGPMTPEAIEGAGKETRPGCREIESGYEFQRSPGRADAEPAAGECDWGTVDSELCHRGRTDIRRDGSDRV